MIGVPIGNRAGCNACFHRSECDCRRNPQNQARIKWARNERLLAKCSDFTAIGHGGNIGRRFTRQLGNGLGCGNFHCLIDRGRPDIECTAENIGKTQDIVDLIGKIRTPCADHRIGTHCACFIGHDFWIGIGQSQDQGLRGHFFEHMRFQNAACGQTEKYICPFYHFDQRALVRLLSENRFPAVHQGLTALIGNAFEIGNPDVFAFDTHGHQQIQARQCRSTRTRCDNLDLAQVFVCKSHRIHHSS